MLRLLALTSSRNGAAWCGTRDRTWRHHRCRAADPVRLAGRDGAEHQVIHRRPGEPGPCQVLHPQDKLDDDLPPHDSGLVSLDPR
jgi:hypothetical protein